MVSLANAISPGVYSSLTDQSFFVNSVGGTGAIMVVFSEKGEDRVLTRVVDQEDLSKKFGRRLIKYGQGMLNAGQFVTNSGNLYILRATLEDAVYATMIAKLVQVDETIYVDAQTVTPPGSPAEGDTVLINGAGTGVFAGHDYQIATYINAEWSYDVVDVGTWVQVGGSVWLLRDPTGYFAELSNIKGITTVPVDSVTPNIDATIASIVINGITINSVATGTGANLLNVEFIEPIGASGLSVLVTSGTDIAITLEKNASGVLLSTRDQIAALLNADVNTSPLILSSANVGNPTEIATAKPASFLQGGTDAVTTLSDGDKFIIDGEDAASGLWEDHDGEIAVWNATDSLWSFETPEFWSWAIAASTNRITQYAGTVKGWDARNSNPGMNAKIKLVKSTSPINSGDELDLNVQSDGSLFGIYGRGRGSWYNDIFLQFSPIITPDSVERSTKIVLSVYQNNPNIGDITLLESFPMSFKSGETDISGESSVLDYVINTYSQDIQIKLNDVVLEDPILINEMNRIEEVQEFGNRTAALSDIFISDELKTDFTGVYKLFGGSDGAQMFNQSGTVDYNSPNVLSALLDAYTGQTDEEILNPDGINISLVYDANYPFAVKAAISQLTQIRKDCGAVIDMNKNLTPKSSVDSRISQFTFNHYQTWLFENVSTIFNDDDGKFIEVTASYHLSSAYPINDSQRNVWDAVSINNAQLNGIDKLTFNPNKSQRDDLYLNQINTIVNLNGLTTIWTQLTSQKRASKLQDISSVRLHLLIDKNLKNFSFGFLPSSNDAITWNKAGKRVREFLGSIQGDRGLESFQVDVGATEFEKRNKTFHINVEYVPINQTEKIFLNYTVK